MRTNMKCFLMIKCCLNIHVTYLSPESRQNSTSHFANLAQSKIIPMKKVQFPDSAKISKQVSLI